MGGSLGESLVTVSAALRRQVYERDGERCVACGSEVGLTIQHREDGMGGNRGETLPYLIVLCAGCNLALTKDSTYRRTGYKHGWQLHHGSDPERVAVFVTWRQEWRRLLPEAVQGELYEVVDGRDQ